MSVGDREGFELPNPKREREAKLMRITKVVVPILALGAIGTGAYFYDWRLALLVPGALIWLDLTIGRFTK